jgi:hypothetical protein
MRRAELLFAVVAAATAVTACGASIQAVYEGDVRFEHCMALDSRADVRPTIRRACWREWLEFYTFGQTRDRVEYAQMRQRQLNASSDFDEGDAPAPRAAPDPTSVLAPPPRVVVADAGPPPAASSAAPIAEPPVPGSDCARECEDGWTKCRKDCAVVACEKACEGRYRRCMRRCY